MGKRKARLADTLVKAVAKRRAPKAPKTKADAPGAKALAGIGDNSRKVAPLERSDREIQDGFIRHLRNINVYEARLTAVKSQLAALYAKAKNDGYKKRQFQLARDFEDVKGEARINALMDDTLRVARWIGHPLGAQLDLFRETPAVPFPRESGRLASMSNKPRKPEIAPNTEAYEQWMEGYDEHQRELMEGFKAQ